MRDPERKADIGDNALLQGASRRARCLDASRLSRIGLPHFPSVRPGHDVDTEHFERILRAYQHRTPFRPFTVALVNGDRFQVDHPEALALRDGVAVLIAADGVPTLFDHKSMSQPDTFHAFAMKHPADINHPFFACGIFRPGQLGCFQLKDLVSEITDPSHVAGRLLLRDGLPIIDKNGHGHVKGMLLRFPTARAAEAYDRISALDLNQA